MYRSKIHTTISQIAGETEFQDEELSTLIEESLRPDSYDYFFDRYHRHIFMPHSNFGGSPLTCQKWYAYAVNNKNIHALGWASHYMQDVSCIYHTTIRGQLNHIEYEVTANENADDYLSMLGQENIRPVEIKNVQDSVMELAESTQSHEQEILDATEVKDGAKVFDLTYERIHEATRYNLGMYQKYKEDVETDKKIEEPFSLSLNMTVGFVFTCFSPYIRKIYPQIPTIYSLLP